MKEYTAKAYRFSELSEKAQQNVIHRWQEEGYHHGDDALETIKRMAQAFDGKVTDWSIDWFGGYSNVEFDMPDYDKKDIAACFKRLDESKDNSCPLTGIFFDISAIEEARKAFDKGLYSLTELMQIAADAVIDDAQKDCEDSFTPEVMSDNCEANDYWFDETGRMLRKELVEA
jgi:hypothetical protein